MTFHFTSLKKKKKNNINTILNRQIPNVALYSTETYYIPFSL